MTFSKEFYDSLEPMECCICKKTFYAPHGMGNNPAPVFPAIEAEDGNLVYECCDRCNDEVVTPARIRGKR